jgi:dihydroorotate dehydrogenase
MRWFYRNFARPILFRQNPELVHDRTLHALGFISRHEWARRGLSMLCGSGLLPVECWGLKFPNPVGLAAGMDKVAEAVPAWEAMGFGHVELGGVTQHGQPGNDRPRVFRAVADEAIVNRMGFNNPGAEEVAKKLRAWRDAGRWPQHPVGMNLGKSKVTPLEEAAEDYCYSYKLVRDLVDFVVVNVSSPNTPNLRKLQDKAALDEILSALQEENGKGTMKPILVKVAPDLTFEALDEIVGLLEARAVAGLVATNTTIQRPSTADAKARSVYEEAGGLSGRPLRARSTEVIAHLYRQTAGRVPIVGVGGIFSVEDAWEKVCAGATLLQIYTGLVYEGPWLVRDLVSGLKSRLEVEGVRSLHELVGSSHR